MWTRAILNRVLVIMTSIPDEVVEEYRKYIFDVKDVSEMNQSKAKELGEQRKTFLKSTGKSLGISAKKLEKDIGKLIKKSKPKPEPKLKPKPKPEEVPMEEEQPEVEASSTTLKRELKPPEENTGRGGYYINSPELLKGHLDCTGNKWRTRFPVSFRLELVDFDRCLA